MIVTEGTPSLWWCLSRKQKDVIGVIERYDVYIHSHEISQGGPAQ
jgi:hypothetical protein